MKETDLDYVAKLEKAIKKKYGEEAIQNPAKFWNEEKRDPFHAIRCSVLSCKYHVNNIFCIIMLTKSYVNLSAKNTESLSVPYGFTPYTSKV